MNESITKTLYALRHTYPPFEPSQLSISQFSLIGHSYEFIYLFNLFKIPVQTTISIKQDHTLTQVKCTFMLLYLNCIVSLEIDSIFV